MKGIRSRKALRGPWVFDGRLGERARELSPKLGEALRGGGSLEGMLKGTAEAVIVVDSSWHVLAMNRTAEELLWLHKEHAAGRPFHALDFSIEPEGAETVLYARGGRRPVMLVEAEIPGPGGLPAGHVIVLEDVGRMREHETGRGWSLRLPAVAEAAGRAMRRVRGPLLGMELPISTLGEARQRPWTYHKGLMN